MANRKKTLKEYLNRGVRQVKHRKGFGVHSPYAYSLITDVIEETWAYYAYRKMRGSYGKQSMIPFKVATLLFRLAVRFRVREVVEIGCDGGYSILPLLLSDSRVRVTTVATAENRQRAERLIGHYEGLKERVRFVKSVADIRSGQVFDMVLVHTLSLRDASMPAAQTLAEWVITHATNDTVIWMRGIQPGRLLKEFWDEVRDHKKATVTMDLYEYGLAILHPYFYKQHYVVAF